MSARLGAAGPVGVTLGDPAGVGAEVFLKAIAVGPAAAVPVVAIGDAALLRETAARLRTPVEIVEVAEDALAADPRSARLPARPGRLAGADRRRRVAVLQVGRLGAAARRPGRPSVAGGRASHAWIVAAARLAVEGRIAAIVTAPINKEWVTRAGFPISGHTELLRDLTGAPDVRMMLAGARLRVTLVTMHVALRDVPAAISTTAVERTIRLTDTHLRRYADLRKPRIAVAGLNPHAGEGGLFGDEEGRVIAPAVVRARRAGVSVQGPFAADSLFFRAVAGEFDAVVALYHDQGLIPLKLLHFHDGVNVTLGLPIVRTSPDHGTAYDIAGRGVADAGSMAAAITLAADMAHAGSRHAAFRVRPPRRPVARVAGAHAAAGRRSHPR